MRALARFVERLGIALIKGAAASVAAGDKPRISLSLALPLTDVEPLVPYADQAVSVAWAAYEHAPDAASRYGLAWPTSLAERLVQQFTQLYPDETNPVPTSSQSDRQRFLIAILATIQFLLTDIINATFECLTDSDSGGRVLLAQDLARGMMIDSDLMAIQTELQAPFRDYPTEADELAGDRSEEYENEQNAYKNRVDPIRFSQHTPYIDALGEDFSSNLTRLRALNAASWYYQPEKVQSYSSQYACGDLAAQSSLPSLWRSNRIRLLCSYGCQRTFGPFRPKSTFYTFDVGSASGPRRRYVLVRCDGSTNSPTDGTSIDSPLSDDSMLEIRCGNSALTIWRLYPARSNNDPSHRDDRQLSWARQLLLSYLAAGGACAQGGAPDSAVDGAQLSGLPPLTPSASLHDRRVHVGASDAAFAMSHADDCDSASLTSEQVQRLDSLCRALWHATAPQQLRVEELVDLQPMRVRARFTAAVLERAMQEAATTTNLPTLPFELLELIGSYQPISILPNIAHETSTTSDDDEERRRKYGEYATQPINEQDNIASFATPASSLSAAPAPATAPATAPAAPACDADIDHVIHSK